MAYLLFLIYLPCPLRAVLWIQYAGVDKELTSLLQKENGAGPHSWHHVSESEPNNPHITTCTL